MDSNGWIENVLKNETSLDQLIDPVRSREDSKVKNKHINQDEDRMVMDDQVDLTSAHVTTQTVIGILCWGEKV